MLNNKYFRRLKKEYRNHYDDMPIEELDISVGLFNYLKRHRVNTYGEIRHLSPWKLARLLDWCDCYISEITERMAVLEKTEKPIETFTPVETLGLDPSTICVLHQYSISSVEALVKVTSKELREDFLGIGPKRLKRISQCLAEHGLSLACSGIIAGENAV